MKPGTLHLSRPSGRIHWLTFVLLIAFIGIAEWITRLAFFQETLTPPKMDARHSQLGHKLALLEAEIKRNGPIDCIMVGSSMVDVGFNPEVFQKGYFKTTGHNIGCFNFGIDASSAASTEIIARILIEDYHPRLLIFGTDPRDYALTMDDRDVTAITDSHWIEYRQGNFTLDGWMLEHSHLYRYRQHLSNLARFNFEGTLWSDTVLINPISLYGFTSLHKVSSYINNPPDLQDNSYETTYYSGLYSSYQMFDENLAALERILSHNGPETQVIVVEMPVTDGFYYFFGNRKTDYKKYVNRISELTNLHRVQFLRTETFDFIPDDSWADYSHLNVTGAGIFSDWLGEQVGKMDIRQKTVEIQP